MRQTISELQGGEKLRAGLTAGAATVGRPTGIDGKKMFPRRAKVTAKEKEKLSAGGPGSGRHAGQYGHYAYDSTSRSTAMYGPFKSKEHAKQHLEKNGRDSKRWGVIHVNSDEAVKQHLSNVKPIGSL